MSFCFLFLILLSLLEGSGFVDSRGREGCPTGKGRSVGEERATDARVEGLWGASQVDSRAVSKGEGWAS